MKRRKRKNKMKRVVKIKTKRRKREEKERQMARERRMRREHKGNKKESQAKNLKKARARTQSQRKTADFHHLSSKLILNHYNSKACFKKRCSKINFASILSVRVLAVDKKNTESHLPEQNL